MSHQQDRYDLARLSAARTGALIRPWYAPPSAPAPSAARLLGLIFGIASASALLIVAVAS